MQLSGYFHSKLIIQNQDPVLFITKLKALQVAMFKLGYQVSNQRIIPHILNSIDKIYEMEMQMIENCIHLLKANRKE
jgi:hypothetical protein